VFKFLFLADKRKVLLSKLMQTLKQSFFLALLLQNGVLELNLALQTLSLEQNVGLELKRHLMIAQSLVL
jgi:hypothetical protein